MFKVFKKQQQIGKNDPEEEMPTQALIIRSVFESGDEFGTEDEIDQVYKLEDKLEETLAQSGYDVDGHEIGDGEFVIYTYGKDANEALSLARVVLKDSPFVWFNMTLRYGSVDDKNAEEKYIRMNSKDSKDE